MRIRYLMLGAAGFLMAAPAFGHAGFLIPLTDGSDRNGEVLLYATFSDSFPSSEIGLTSDNWVIVKPSGETSAFSRSVERPTQTILETHLEEDGLYRLSSGERLGRKGEVARIDGQYQLLGRDGLDKNTLPPTAEILTSQTATLSDIYLSRNTASGAALDTRLGRLEISPITDPTSLRVGTEFKAAVMFDGQKLGDEEMTLFSPGSSREEGKADTSIATDEHGVVRFTPSSAGPHLLMIRKIAPSPQGADTDVRSYTTTLTLEAR